MNVDEIDTVLLLRTPSPTDSGRKPILQQNYIQLGRPKGQRQTGIRNSQVCEIVTSFLACRTGVIFCVFQGNRGEGEASESCVRGEVR